jgi:hypothetical protein
MSVCVDITANLKNYVIWYAYCLAVKVFLLFRSVTSIGSQSSSVIVPSMDGHSLFMSLVCHVSVACTGTSDCSLC